MKTLSSASLYKGFRFPPEIISHCVWLYFRFSLSFRDIEELMAERRVALTYETVRQWCLKFGQTYANELKRRRPQTGDKWHAGRACFSKSMGRSTICGEPSIKMGTGVLPSYQTTSKVNNLTLDNTRLQIWNWPRKM